LQAGSRRPSLDVGETNAAASSPQWNGWASSIVAPLAYAIDLGSEHRVLSLRRLPPLVLAVLSILPRPAMAQEELQPIEQPQQLAPDALQLAQQAAARGDAAEALSRYLRILAAAPDNVPALLGAGRAALGVGDTNAAAGFLSRADVLDSHNGQVKAALGSMMLAQGNARAALRLFNEAVTLGVPQADIAADRGLAYD
jgi:tetratricopeptide (TPR) repeat protein